MLGGMASIREQIAAQCQVGTLKFWATGLEHGGSRRVARYSSIGRTGGDSEDFGADALAHPIKAYLTEPTYFDLFELMNEGKVLDCVHPFLGSMRARLLDVKGSFGLEDGVEATFTLLEEGDHTQVVVGATSSPAAANQAARGAFDDLDDALDGLADIPDAPSGLTDASAGMTSSWETFDGSLTGIEQGSGSWQSVEASLGELGDAAAELVAQADAVALDVDGLLDLGIPDLTYSLMDAARTAADVCKREVASIWKPVRVSGPVSLAALAREMVGDDSDATFDRILDANPELIDLGALVAGTELVIPVPLVS
jgi:hypothetical protein